MGTRYVNFDKFTSGTKEGLVARPTGLRYNEIQYCVSNPSRGRDHDSF